jgi:hypothetical protein
MRSEPVVLGTFTAGADGIVRGTVRIPANATPGQHTLELSGIRAGGGTRTATATFTVTGADLPRTGSDTTRVLSVALMLLGVGCLGSAHASSRLARRTA